MADLAAHLVDDLVGGLPVRQWIFSLPHQLRPTVHLAYHGPRTFRRVTSGLLSEAKTRRSSAEPASCVAATRIGYAVRPVFALELGGVSKRYGRRAAL